VRAENRSVFHRTANLQPLIDFVTRHVPDVVDTKFIFEDLKDPQRPTGGITIRQGSLVTVVMIGLGRARRSFGYPSRNHHSMPEVDAEVGGTVFESWDEEVVFTMLHESRHVRQFASGTFEKWQEIDSEIDAERFAKRLFRIYKREAKSNAVALAA
jgi:hypothetical protein